MASVTTLRLPHNLPYPISIQRLHVLPSKNSTSTNTINKTDTLLTYSYYVETPEGTREKEVRVWESPVNGELIKWCVREGDSLRNSNDAVIHIQEPCTHDVQLHGLCALCGKDLTTADYTGFSDTSRANISMAHDVGGLTVSLDEAHRLETATTTRLLSTQKLSLIVDLDQTIVHATVDPTVGEWLDDPTNPNYPALAGTGKFKLGEEREGAEGDGCWYYVKMRPGLNDFLRDVSDMYEMHVYTMGTRAYASEVCKIIDPDGGLFGGRILSRDESGSMTRKSLQRLFPCDTSMVVIIDDRADVWDGSPNLVKVIPYEFFVGIGDINAAFLPKKKDLTPPPIPAAPVASSSNLNANDITTTPISATIPLPVVPALDISVLEAVPSPFTTDSTIFSPSLSEAEASTALTIHDQIESRPLSKLNPTESEGGSSQSSISKTGDDLDVIGSDDVVEEVDIEEELELEMEMGAVLRDDDRELDRLFSILKAVHVEFFKDIQRRDSDVKIIIPNMKKAVLRGVNLVFSGLIALGVNARDSEYWKLADTFGADCSTQLKPATTHVVANQNGTEKVYLARKRPSIKVVGAQWLLDSIAHWTHLSESSYLLPLPPPTTSSNPPPNASTSQLPPSFGIESPLLVETELPIPEELQESLIEEEEEEEERPNDSQSGSQMGDEGLDINNVDWGDASKEIEDALNDTDDDGEFDGGEVTDDGDLTDSSIQSDHSDGRSFKQGKKRERERDSGDESTNTKGKGKGKLSSSSPTKESPLQKRVKTAMSRKSRLKISYPAEGEEISSPAQVEEEGVGGYEGSQGSSSLDSDDDAFFASMASELESGWE